MYITLTKTQISINTTTRIHSQVHFYYAVSHQRATPAFPNPPWRRRHTLSIRNSRQCLIALFVCKFDVPSSIYSLWLLDRYINHIERYIEIAIVQTIRHDQTDVDDANDIICSVECALCMCMYVYVRVRCFVTTQRCPPAAFALYIWAHEDEDYAVCVYVGDAFQMPVLQL